MMRQRPSLSEAPALASGSLVLEMMTHLCVRFEHCFHAYSPHQRRIPLQSRSGCLRGEMCQKGEEWRPRPRSRHLQTHAGRHNQMPRALGLKCWGQEIESCDLSLNVVVYHSCLNTCPEAPVLTQESNPPGTAAEHAARPLNSVRHDAKDARYPKPEFVQLQLPPL